MTVNTYNDRPILVSYILVLFALMCLYCVGTSLSGESYNKLLREGGVVETLSAAFYFILAALMLFRAGKDFLIQKHYIVLLILFCGFRELDFDKKFTTMGIFKSKFFFSGEVPVVEKLIGTIVLLALLYLIVQLVRNHFIPFIKETKKCTAVNIGIWLVMLFLVFSKSIDGLDRKLKGFGVEISYLFTDNAAALEEILELGVPTIMLLAAHAYFRQRTGGNGEMVNGKMADG